MEGFDACRTGYAACVYHLERLADFENSVHTVLSQFDFSETIEQNISVCIGDMKRIDFEYHAFVMACRRSLDGIAWGLSTYFKSEQSSFNRFTKVLAKYHPTPVAAALAAVCELHVANVDFILGAERGQSIRDRIAHREAVQSGVINIGADGHRILGGGENLGRQDHTSPARLAFVLNKRRDALHACISDLLRSFRSAVTEYERSH